MALRESIKLSGTPAPLLQCQRYGVMGAGLSGRAAAAVLLELGKEVTLFDDFARSDAPEMEEIRQGGARFRFGPEGALVGPAGAMEEGIEALIVSPGVASDHSLIEQAAARGLPVQGELELGWLLAEGARTVAVTGTNGKTTVTMLIQKMLADAGIDAIAAGNIGLPLCEAVRQAAAEGADQRVFVVEVSSFQLETIERFRPDVALLLNITHDHLDRHHTMETYAEIKGRVTATQGQGQVLIINQDDPYCLAIAAGSRARVRRFSLDRAVEDGAWLDGDLLALVRPDQRPHRVIAMDELPMIGLHNVSNAMAALCAADALGVGRKSIKRTLKDFHAAPHRMELIAELEGVEYINDSKATNLGAMRRAIETFAGGIHLIAGGRDKNSPFACVSDLLASRLRGAYLIGEAAEPMKRAWGGAVPCLRCQTLERALEAAAKRAEAGEIVLLSPGCASFDQFRSYADRGERFAQWVRGCQKQKKFSECSIDDGLTGGVELG